MPSCFGLSGLRAHEAEDHVGLCRGRGPDLLAVDDEIVAVFHRACGKRGEIAARAGLGIALTPDHFAAQRRADPALFLFFGAEFEQRRHQHRDALVRHAHRQTGRDEFFRDDAGFQDVGRAAEAAILLGDRARRIAMLDQQALPGAGFFVEAESARCACTKIARKGPHLFAEDFIFVRVGEVHFTNSLSCPTSASAFASVREGDPGREANRSVKIFHDLTSFTTWVPFPRSTDVLLGRG